jgi:hypothetical protein
VRPFLYGPGGRRSDVLNQDTDCQVDGGAGLPHCVRHACAADQCLDDTDCSGGAVCVCAIDAGFGLVLRLNRCVPSTCRVDADCPSELCSTGYGPCNSPTGYNCRSAADTCCADDDCTGSGVPVSCNFAPETGHWQCQPTVVCGG